MKTMLDVDELVFNPPELGCVLYVPGPSGGGSKISDRSPYGHTGSITGACWVRTPGGLWYLSFDGQDDKVACGNLQIHNLAAYTIRFWVKANVQNDKRVLSENGASAFFGLGTINTSFDEMRIYILDDDNTVRLDATTGVANPVFDGVWRCVTWVDNEGAYQVYMNKAADIGGTYTKNSKTLTHTTIGAHSIGAGGSFLDGSVALVQAYNRALTDLEVSNLFDREKYLFGAW